MLFSIITITYNAAETLPPTLESVAAQQMTDFEYLLIDGASTDMTLTLAAEAPIANKTIISRPDKGLYDAMNRGLHAAQGRYVIFLNAGDSFPSPLTLQTYADAIHSAPQEPGIVYGQTMLVNFERQIIGPRHLTAPATLSARSFLDGMTVCHQAMAVRHDLAPDYDLQYRFSADYDWVIKVLKKSTLNVFTGQVTAHYLSEGITTKNHRASLLERLRIMAKHYGIMPALGSHLKKIGKKLAKLTKNS
ncbi:MAG: glycosyltransferase [Muribaculaceae bacterium]|nr:glycosyltransferase [Muribaculaceae bacterium]